MILKLYGSKRSQIIHLDKSFFTTEKQKRRGKNILITPKDKALQIGLDTLGNDYEGHILEQDGEVIENSLENREHLHLNGNSHGFSNTKPIKGFGTDLSSKIAAKFK